MWLLRAAHIRVRSSQQLQGRSTGLFQHVAQVVAPRTFVLSLCSSFKDSYGLSPRDGVRAWFKTVRTQQSRFFESIRSQVWCAGTVQDWQDATVKFIRRVKCQE
eukprot:9077835-Pyramimonas_sp.AAC.1